MNVKDNSSVNSHPHWKKQKRSTNNISNNLNGNMINEEKKKKIQHNGQNSNIKHNIINNNNHNNKNTTIATTTTSSSSSSSSSSNGNHNHNKLASVEQGNGNIKSPPTPKRNGFTKREQIESTPTTSTTITQHAGSKQSDKIMLQRRALPIYSAREKLISEIAKTNSAIIVGETGSGKTTQIPQYLRDAGYVKNGMVAITQPRRVAAVTIAKRVALEVGVRLGDEVGYTVRFDDTTSPKTEIKYLTDGMLIREAMLDPLLRKYSVIVLDEAHERTLHTDVLFAIVKNIQKTKRPELKIIIMSATLDADKFSEYFGAPILYIEGRQYPVDIYFSDEPQTDYLDAALITILQIHLGEPLGDILCFLTGREDIETLQKLLEEKIKLFTPEIKDLHICPIYAALPPEQQLKVFEPAPPNSRKVILSTNIAETSITINGVVKARSYLAKSGMDTLLVVPASKAACRQRAGRAGRESSGKCFRLFTEASYLKMPDNTLPEIKRSNMEHVVLQLKAIGIDGVIGFDFMDKPPVQAIRNAIYVLVSLDALSSDENLKITELGKRMAGFPLDPMFSKVVINSKNFGCLNEVLSIVAMLSVETVFLSPKDRKKEAAAAKANFSHPDGDHMMLLNVYKEYVSQAKKTTWCWDNFISLRMMEKIMQIRKQLADYVGVVSTAELGAGSDQIRKCFLTGFCLNIAQLQPDKKYLSMRDKKEVFIHPSSVFCGKKPEWLFYNELVYTTKYYMRGVSTIEHSWLPEVAPALYDKKNVVLPAINSTNSNNKSNNNNNNNNNNNSKNNNSNNNQNENKSRKLGYVKDANMAARPFSMVDDW